MAVHARRRWPLGRGPIGKLRFKRAIEALHVWHPLYGTLARHLEVRHKRFYKRVCRCARQPAWHPPEGDQLEPTNVPGPVHRNTRRNACDRCLLGTLRLMRANCRVGQPTVVQSAEGPVPLKLVGGRRAGEQHRVAQELWAATAGSAVRSWIGENGTHAETLTETLVEHMWLITG